MPHQIRVLMPFEELLKIAPRISFLTLLLFCGLVLHAQQPFSRQSNLPDPFRKEPIDQIFQTKEGLLWIGTRAGLMAFDGLDYHFYPSPDTTNQSVSALFEDDQHRIWVGYINGHIDVLEPDSKALTVFSPEEGMPSVPITSIVAVTNQIWIGTYGEGAYIWNGQRLYNLNEDDGLVSPDIYTLAADIHGRVWAGTDAGLVELRFYGDFKKHVNTITKGLPDQIVRAILPAPNGSLWLGFFDGGIALYNPLDGKTQIPFPIWKHGSIQALALFPNQELWIATSQDGLFRYDLQQNKISRIDCQSGRVQNKINDLIADAEGNIWISTPTQGLISYTAKIRRIAGSAFNVQAVLEDRDGQLWAGTPQGLYRLQYDQECGWIWPSKTTGLAGRNILCLSQGPDDAIWAGTFGDGLFRFDPVTTKTLQFSEKDGLGNGNILSILWEEQKMWLTTLGGVSFMEWMPYKAGKSIVQNLAKTYGLSNQFIYCSYHTPDGTFWFGTDGNGLMRLDTSGNIQQFTTVAGLPLHTVYAIIGDNRGHLWVSSPDRGIIEFDGRTFKILPLKSGLTNSGIMGLAKDQYGNILFPYETGIAILEPKTRHLVYFDKGVGLDEFSPNLNAISSSPTGTVWAGGDNGIYSYKSLYQSPQIHPKTVIFDFGLLEGKSLTSASRLSADDNYLRFNFAGLWYTNPEKVRYRYKLEGYDRDWKMTRDRQVIYSNLPGGYFEFHLQSSENEVFTDEPEIVVPFSIRASWYLQWWFLMLLFISIGSLIFWIIKSREKRLSLAAKIKRERVEMQLEILKSQINPHFLFNSFNSLLAVIEKNPAEAIHYVEELSEFFRFILAYREKELIPLHEEITLIKHYGKLLARRFGPALQLSIELTNTDGYVVPLTLQLLVENAVKHNVASRAKPLAVRIFRTDNALVIENNRQLKDINEPSTGIGLHNLESQYFLLCGQSIIIDQEPTVFRVSIPLIMHS